MRTVSDTSPISNLAIIGQLELLRDQFEQVMIPGAVFSECKRMDNPSAKQVILKAVEDGWLIVAPITNGALVESLLADLDRGESEAIALAIESRADLLLLDEREGRRVARQSGLQVRGVLGVLMRAKVMGSLTTIKPSIDLLKSKARFFIAPELEKAILADAGEPS
jgi:predicted nucleic acid-binding protein